MSHPNRTLYGRRKGRPLRPGRAALLTELLPRLTVALPPPGEALEWRALFPRPVESLWLEVGFGAGEHLAWQAAAHPQIGFIGCEPFVNGMSALLHAVAEQGLDTVRVYPGDAREVIAVLPEASVGRCFVLFPDPWPKTRHHRRRFIGPETLDALARVMQDGAELRLASDHPGLVDWMLFHTRRHPAFAWTAEGPWDWRDRPPDWPATRYEAKALHGTPVFLRFRRRERPPGSTKDQGASGRAA